MGRVNYLKLDFGVSQENVVICANWTPQDSFLKAAGYKHWSAKMCRQVTEGVSDNKV